MDVDSKRSGVKAVITGFHSPPFELLPVEGRDRPIWYGPPGSYTHISRDDKSGRLVYALCCPGCGRLSGPKADANWQVVKGSLEDVTTLTLRPSIANECCGWHGFLTNGIFSINPEPF